MACFSCVALLRIISLLINEGRGKKEGVREKKEVRGQGKRRDCSLGNLYSNQHINLAINFMSDAEVRSGSLF